MHYKVYSLPAAQSYPLLLITYITYYVSLDLHDFINQFHEVSFIFTFQKLWCHTEHTEKPTLPQQYTLKL